MLCRLVDSDLWISRDPYPIAAMRHGISQAVARHVLSHKEVSPKGGWRLDGLLASVTGPLSAQQQRNRRREIHQDVEALLRLGINLHDGRVHMTRKGAVCSKTVGPCSIPAAWFRIKKFYAGALKGAATTTDLCANGRRLPGRRPAWAVVDYVLAKDTDIIHPSLILRSSLSFSWSPMGSFRLPGRRCIFWD